jgi:hypothetical protein
MINLDNLKQQLENLDLKKQTYKTIDKFLKERVGRYEGYGFTVEAA